MSYYIPKKNRCSCLQLDECSVPNNIFLRFSTSSNTYTSTLKSKHVYTTETNLNTDKGQGNLIKRGSGGSSYDAYLAKKKGLLFCNCTI